MATLIYAIQSFTATDGTVCTKGNTYNLSDSAANISFQRGQGQPAALQNSVNSSALNQLQYQAGSEAVAGVSNGLIFDEEGNEVTGKSLRGVSTRLTIPTFITGNAQYGDFGRVYTALDWIRTPVVQYHNWYNTNEGNASGSVQIDFTFEYPIGSDANIMPGGSLFVAQNGNTTYQCPKLPRPIPPNAKYRVRTYRVGSAAGSYPVMRDGFQARYGLLPGDYCSYGTTAGAVPNTINGGTPGTQGDIFGWTYGPTVVADYSDIPCIFVASDSRDMAAYAFDGNLDMNGFQGKIVRSVAGRVCVINGAVTGDSFFNVVGAGNQPYVNRLAASQYATHTLCGLGVNDTLMTLDEYKTNTLALKNKIGANKPFWVDTIYAFTTSTDLWATTANQTIVRANNAEINRAIRAGIVGPWIDGFIDSASAVETTPGSEIWKTLSEVGARIVNDGATGTANTGANNVVTSATAAFTQADLGSSLQAYKKIAISSITWLSNIATVTTTPAHGLSTGNAGFVHEADVAGYNLSRGGTNMNVVITVTGANTFTYPLTTNPGGSATTGFFYRPVLGSNTSTSASPNAIIGAINSPTSVTIVNTIGGFASTTASTGVTLVVGALHQDGLHAFPKGELEIANSRGMNNLRIISKS